MRPFCARSITSDGNASVTEYGGRPCRGLPGDGIRASKVAIPASVCRPSARRFREFVPEPLPATPGKFGGTGLGLAIFARCEHHGVNRVDARRRGALASGFHPAVGFLPATRPRRLHRWADQIAVVTAMQLARRLFCQILACAATPSSLVDGGRCGAESMPAPATKPPAIIPIAPAFAFALFTHARGALREIAGLALPVTCLRCPVIPGRLSLLCRADSGRRCRRTALPRRIKPDRKPLPYRHEPIRASRPASHPFWRGHPSTAADQQLLRRRGHTVTKSPPCTEAVHASLEAITTCFCLHATCRAWTSRGRPAPFARKKPNSKAGARPSWPLPPMCWKPASRPVLEAGMDAFLTNRSNPAELEKCSGLLFPGEEPFAYRRQHDGIRRAVATVSTINLSRRA